MHAFSVVAVSVWLLLSAAPAFSFGVDVCFNDPEKSGDIIRNCIGVDRDCRHQPLSPEMALQCRILALADSLGGLSGSNAIIGGRSTIHSDALYLIAQLNGFSPWQAYQIMIYSEATDQSDYEPFDQAGKRMMSLEAMQACYDSGMEAARECLAITPQLSGVYKFNDTTGGQLLHLHARYAPTEASPPRTPFPTDYTGPDNQDAERLLYNLREWAFDARSDACVSGITVDMDPAGACLAGRKLVFPMNFFGFGYDPAAIPFVAETGTFRINEEPLVTSTEADMDGYLPHDPRMARMGIYLHSLADRASHHMCTDVAWFYPTTGGDFTSEYPSVACGQGNHFLWHVWEQGTNQDRIMGQRFQTMEPALGNIWRELESRALSLGVTPRGGVDRQRVIGELVHAIGLYDPQRRMGAINAIIERRGLVPLPGHGRYRDRSLAGWLDDVGATFE